MTPIASIIIPVFNRRDLVQRAIRSALSQSIRDIEVIVVDNCSTDGTFEACQDLAKVDQRLKVFRNSENIGPVRNWFACLEKVSSPYTKFLFSDDLLSPDCLERLLPALDDPGCGLAYSAATMGSEDWIGQASYVYGLDDTRITSGVFISASIRAWGLTPVSPGAALFRTDDVRKSLLHNLDGVDGYDFESTGAGIDWLLYLLTAERYQHVSYIAKPLSFFRAHDGSISTKNRGADVIRGYELAAQWFQTRHQRTGRPPRITAIVSTYKSAQFIAECLDDLLAQTVADQLEIIVIDANSPENEGEIVKSYQQANANIRYVRTPTRIGIYAAWNVAIGLARGEFLISASTNDRLRKTACEVLMRTLDENPEVMVAYGDSLITETPHQTFEEATPSSGHFWPDYSYELLLKNCMVGCHPMWRRQVHASVGLFDESYIAIGDQDMWLRIGERFPLKHVRYPTGLYLASPDSLSGNVSTASREIERAHTTFQTRDTYRKWIARTSIEEVSIQGFAERMLTKWKTKPQFLLTTVVSRDDMARVTRTIQSLQSQLYSGWTLVIIADFPAPDPVFESSDVLGWLEIESTQNDELVATAVNQVTDTVPNDWMCWISPGTQIAPECLLVVADYINLRADWLAIYCDHDLVDPDGLRHTPWFKPDLSIDYLRSMDYIGEACWFSHNSLRAIGGFTACPGAWHMDAILRILERTGNATIGHVSHMLVHMDSSGRRHPLHNAAGQFAIESHLMRQNVAATIEPGLGSDTRVVRYLNERTPLISIVIPNKNSLEFLEPCLESLLAITDYKNYEIIVVDNGSSDPDLIAYYQRLTSRQDGNIHILPYPDEFNYSAMCNRAATIARGEFLLFLNNDVQILHRHWLSRMVAHALRAEVGVVGAKLVYPETGKVQHAGVVLGIGQCADHPFISTLDHDAPGYMNRAVTDQNYSAVTGACLLVSKDIYWQVDGHNERDLPVSFSDIDLCLKVRELGKLVVWTPHATLVHHGSVSQKAELADLAKAAANQQRFAREKQYLLTRWPAFIANDPAYNRNLSLVHRDMRPEIEVPTNWDINFRDRPTILGSPLHGGSGDYRMVQPFKALAKEGKAHCELVLSPTTGTRIPSVTELLRLRPDVFVVHAAINSMEIALLETLPQHLPNTRRIFMLDDLLTAVPEKSSFYKGFTGQFRNARQCLRQALTYCDRLIVSTPFLQDVCQEFIKDIVVVPNRLPTEPWLNLTRSRKPRPKPRVGWAGAQQHQGDLEVIQEVVKVTAAEVDWIFMGMCPDPVRPYIKEFHEFVPLDQYPAKLAGLDLDLAVAPLEIHPFNQAKSNLRILEYGILGWPVICTDIDPYRYLGPPVTLLDNDAQQWIDALRRKIADPEGLKAEGEQLRQWVMEHFMLENNVAAWEDALLKH